MHKWSWSFLYGTLLVTHALISRVIQLNIRSTAVKFKAGKNNYTPLFFVDVINYPWHDPDAGWANVCLQTPARYYLIIPFWERNIRCCFQFSISIIKIRKFIFTSMHVTFHPYLETFSLLTCVLKHDESTRVWYLRLPFTSNQGTLHYFLNQNVKDICIWHMLLMGKKLFNIPYRPRVWSVQLQWVINYPCHSHMTLHTLRIGGYRLCNIPSSVTHRLTWTVMRYHVFRQLFPTSYQIIFESAGSLDDS